MILTSTIQKDKGFRSVVNKLIIQVAAKLGYVPWTIDNMVFNDKPTMVVGIDTTGQAGKGTNSVYGMVATCDENFSQYWSQVENQNKT